MYLTNGLKLSEMLAVGRSGGTVEPTNCWTDGTSTNVLKALPDGGFGNDDAQSPSNGIDPNLTSDLQHVYSFRFYATGHVDEGLWVLQLGIAGDEISALATKGVLNFDLTSAENVLMVWNETNLRYEGFDIGTADAVAEHVDMQMCFAMSITPHVLIKYYFASMLTDGNTEDDGSWKLYTSSSTPNPLEVRFKSPVGTFLEINDTEYEGNDDTEVVVNIGWSYVGDTVSFKESTENSLTYFYCYDNQLTGSIPDLSSNVSLEQFYIQMNRLTGSIPNLSNNVNLELFYCYSNQLTGSIPDLSSNVSLELFYCHHNQLTGSIPDLSNNVDLEFFSCNYNQLTGSIPDLSNNIILTEFYCYSNQLTDFAGGSISVATYFHAHDNLLTETAVDNILAGLVSGNTVNAEIRLETGNSAPSPAGEASIDTLRANGNGVTVEGGY